MQEIVSNNSKHKLHIFIFVIIYLQITQFLMEILREPLKITGFRLFEYGHKLVHKVCNCVQTNKASLVSEISSLQEFKIQI